MKKSLEFHVNFQVGYCVDRKFFHCKLFLESSNTMELQNQASELANKIKDITSEHPFMSLATLGAITVPYFLYKRYVS